MGDKHKTVNEDKPVKNDKSDKDESANGLNKEVKCGDADNNSNNADEPPSRPRSLIGRVNFGWPNWKKARNEGSTASTNEKTKESEAGATSTNEKTKKAEAGATSTNQKASSAASINEKASSVASANEKPSSAASTNKKASTAA